MARNHKGTELNNVRETWEKNEREYVNTNAAATTDENLQRVIEEESSEYENTKSEDKLLSGDRASIDDDSKDA